MSLNFFYPKGKYPEKDPVVDLLPEGYRSAAIIFPPFFQMPVGWDPEDAPSEVVVYQSASPIRWNEIRQKSNLNSISEVSLAVKAYVTGGDGISLYQRMDLYENVLKSIEAGAFFPYEDQLPILLIDDMLNLLGSRGAKKVFYNKLDGDGQLALDDIKLEQKLFLCSGPALLMDEQGEYVFTCFFDESIVFFTKEDNLGCFKGTNFEGVYLEKETPLIWENSQCTYFNYNRT